MVTAALPRNNAPKIGAGRQFDNVFFSGMAFLILVTVFTGFARTYFLAGVFRAPLPNLLIHIHGAVFSSWILLLITQTALVSAGRVDIHRRLGLAGFGLACLMVILGVMAGTNNLPPDTRSPARDPTTFLCRALPHKMVVSPPLFLSVPRRP